MFFVSLLALPGPQASPVTLPKPPKTATEQDASVQGGGHLRVNGETFAFHPTSVQVGHNATLGQAVKLKGRLTPATGAAWEIELQITETGQLVLMQCFRKEGGKETGRWSPTLKTTFQWLSFEPLPGGTLRLRLSGPLSGVVGASVKQATWTGEIWAKAQ